MTSENLVTRIPQVYRRNLLDTETFRAMLLAREFLAANYATPITLKSAADMAGFSMYHFQRLFTRAFDESPLEFLTRLRLERAQILLRSSDYSVSEVCLEVGYSSLGSFSTLFSKRLGVAPSEYRRVFSFPGLWELKSIPACMRFMRGM